MTLGKRYDEVMEHIEVTSEMRQRILKNIEQADLTKAAPRKVVRFPYIKQLAALAACLVVVLVGALTLPSLFQDPDELGVLAPGGGIVQVSTAEELAETVGFEVGGLNGLPFQVEKTTYTAYWQELAEIIYSGEGQTAIYRKGTGSEDVSGDYNVYESETETLVDGITITLKGNGGVYALAIWTDGEYAYSLALSDGATDAEWQTIFTGEF